MRPAVFSPFSALGFVANCVCVCVCTRCNIQFFVTPQTVARRIPLSMGFPRQKYWSRLPFPTPRDLPDPGMPPATLARPALAGEFVTLACHLRGPTGHCLIGTIPTQSLQEQREDPSSGKGEMCMRPFLILLSLVLHCSFIYYFFPFGKGGKIKIFQY